MKFYTIFKQSLRAILNNKGRSFLTILGIVIGIGSVIALVSFGTGVKASVSDRISTLGTNNITIMPGEGFNARSHMEGGRSEGGGGFSRGTSSLTVADYESLQEHDQHPLIKLVSGQMSGSAILTTSAGDQRYSIMGTSPDYISIQNLKLKQGSFYNQTDIGSKNRVMVLGSKMAADLYGSKSALGQTLAIEGADYKIIGVFKEADENSFNNPNNQAYVPYTAAMDSFKTSNFSAITVQAVNDKVLEQVKKDIKNTLLTNHQIKDAKLADFNVSSSADLLSTVNSITGMLTSLLAGIAAISLLVGGIGIMNIMLVSVTERTREIGLRKAVGAKTLDIMSQFVIEAILLTLCGGIFGIGLGFFIGKIAAPGLGFTPIITSSSVALAVGVSSFIGLLFGVYPAAKAARLNPIDALRYE